MIAGYTELASNLARSVIHRQVIGPYDMEHTYGLIGGNIFHGELSVDQLFHNRLKAGFADFRSPIVGLYQAHSATHGGGGVCGIPGWQAARAVLADQHRRRPWRRNETGRRPWRRTTNRTTGLSTDPEESRDDSAPPHLCRSRSSRPASARSAIADARAARTPIPTCWRGSRSTSSMGAGSAPVARPTSRRHDPSGPYASARPACC